MTKYDAYQLHDMEPVRRKPKHPNRLTQFCFRGGAATKLLVGSVKFNV